MNLPRLHLFELEDQQWFPKILRDYATDYLQAAQQLFPIDNLLVEPLARTLEESEENRIVDLCSGASGPIIGVCQALESHGHHVHVTLTDYYPNLDAFSHLAQKFGNISYRTESVDVQDVPANLPGVRTIFNGIHHFRPAQVETILRDATTRRQPMAIFDLTRRRITSILGMLLTPLMVWAITPRMRPFRWSRLLLTYLIPLVPLVVLWDGLVSQFRAYDPEELLELAEGCSSDYTWRCGLLKAGPVPITFLTGVPRRIASEKGPLGEDVASQSQA